MGICSSVDVQKSPLSSPKRQPSSSQARELYSGQPTSTSNQQGDGPADTRNAYPSEHDSAHQHRGDHQSSSRQHTGTLRQNSNHQSSSQRYQNASPAHTADQAYHQSRHRTGTSERHRAATDYREDYRHRDNPHNVQRSSSHHHSGGHHQQSSDYYHSSSPRSSRSSRFGSARRKQYQVVPVTAENLQQHTRSYTTPKMHTVHDVIEEAVAEDKAARRSENFDMSEEEPYNFSEAGTKPFTMDRIPVKNDNGISSERSMARSRRRTRTATSGASGTLSSVGSDGAMYDSHDNYNSNLPTGLQTPSYSRSRMRHMSQGSIGTVQSQFNGPIPAHAKGIHGGSSSRLMAPGNPHNSVSRSITDVPSIPEPHVAQHGHSNAPHNMHAQRGSSHTQLMSSPRTHTSSPHISHRSGTPQPNEQHLQGGQGMVPDGDQRSSSHLLDPRRVDGMNIQNAATPTSMYAQHGDATPPPHNLSSADFVPDSRDYNEYRKLGDETPKSNGAHGSMHNMGHVEGHGYTASQHKQPLHSLSESY